jgi:hypothetical protein
MNSKDNNDNVALRATVVTSISTTGRVDAQSSQGPTAMAPGAPASTEDQPSGITMTANRREENQQRGGAVSGAVFNRQANGTIPFIRGVGNANQTPGDEPSAARYVCLGKWDYNIALNHIGDYSFEPDNGQGQIAPSSSSNDKQPLTNLVNASVC